MSVPAGAVYVGGIACTPDGAVYVTPTGTANITGGNTWFVPPGGSSGVPVSVPADTTLDQLQSFTLPALNAASGVYGISQWSYTNNADTKTVAVKLGGTTIATTTMTTTGIAKFEWEFYNNAATNAQLGIWTMTIGNAVTTGSINSSVETNAGATLAIFGQKNTSSADTVTLNNFNVEVYKP